MKMESVRNAFTLVSHFLLALTMMSLVAAAQLEYPVCINNTGNYTIGSAYQTNLNNLLSSLPSDVDPFGFNSSTAGSDSDQVYSLVLCRGDVDHVSCRKCVNDAVSKLPASCPGYKVASGFYENCMIRYSNRSLLTGFVSSSHTLFVSQCDRFNSTNSTQFNQDLTTLMIDLRTKAAKGGSRLKFAAEQKPTLQDFQTIYGMVQCTPDLTEEECNNCLLDAISQIPRCCDGKKGGRVVTYSCNLRFETYPFYNQTGVQAVSPPPPPPPLPSPAESPPPPTGNINNGKSNHTIIIIIIIVISSSSVMIISLYFIIISRRSKIHKMMKKKRLLIDSSMNYDLSSTETLQYKFKTIQEATDNFSIPNRLGHGGFGIVYKGRLSNGKQIAVKRLAEGSEQGKAEFENEIVLMSRLKHRNLAKLLGFCLQGKERLIVYEFLPNRSLDHFIFHSARRMLLNWETRFKIIAGVARGLVYLHEGSNIRIIHHDLKASNVLLDQNMNPCISDFGMARLFQVDKSLEITKRIAGTYGYIAPEFAYHGQYSTKTDVFSFGVMILEIVTGKKNSSSNESESESSPVHLLSYVWKKWRKGKLSNLIDRTIINDGSNAEKMRCIHIGLLCVQEVAVKRPTMASVMLMLDSCTMSLSIPSKPGFLMDDDVSTGQQSSPSPPEDIDGNHQTINDVSFTDPYPR